MGSERRSTQRFDVTIDIEWETLAGRRPGTLSDINQLGCFVLSEGNVQDGDTVKLFFPLSDGMAVQFLALVTNHVFEIGFAATFQEMSDSQKDFLRKFIDSHSVA